MTEIGAIVDNMAFWCAIVAIAFCVTQHIHRLEASPILPRFQQRHAIVDTHNALRRKISLRWPSRAMASNMKKMKWDLSLAIQATVEATCAKLEEYISPGSESDSKTTSSFISNVEDSYISTDSLSSFEPEIGKNIAYTSKKNIKHMIQSWFKQQKHYNQRINRCRPGTQCEEFLQLAWAEADRVGCSFNAGCTYQGKDIKFLVCLYNVKYQEYKRPYQIGKTCSKCDSSAGFCEDGLCVPTCFGSTGKFCECKKKCHHHGVGQGTLDRASCSCTCASGLGPDCEDKCENPMDYVENLDACAGWNTEEFCSDPSMVELQKELCPANCQYGCKKYHTRTR